MASVSHPVSDSKSPDYTSGLSISESPSVSRPANGLFSVRNASIEYESSAHSTSNSNYEESTPNNINGSRHVSRGTNGEVTEEQESEKSGNDTLDKQTASSKRYIAQIKDNISKYVKPSLYPEKLKSTSNIKRLLSASSSNDGSGKDKNANLRPRSTPRPYTTGPVGVRVCQSVIPLANSAGSENQRNSYGGHRSVNSYTLADSNPNSSANGFQTPRTRNSIGNTFSYSRQDSFARTFTSAATGSTNDRATGREVRRLLPLAPTETVTSSHVSSKADTCSQGSFSSSAYGSVYSEHVNDTNQNSNSSDIYADVDELYTRPHTFSHPLVLRQKQFLPPPPPPPKPPRDPAFCGNNTNNLLGLPEVSPRKSGQTRSESLQNCSPISEDAYDNTGCPKRPRSDAAILDDYRRRTWLPTSFQSAMGNGSSFNIKLSTKPSSISMNGTNSMRSYHSNDALDTNLYSTSNELKTASSDMAVTDDCEGHGDRDDLTGPPRLAPVSGQLQQNANKALIRPIAFKPVVSAHSQHRTGHTNASQRYAPASHDTSGSRVPLSPILANQQSTQRSSYDDRDLTGPPQRTVSQPYLNTPAPQPLRHQAFKQSPSMRMLNGNGGMGSDGSSTQLHQAHFGYDLSPEPQLRHPEKQFYENMHSSYSQNNAVTQNRGLTSPRGPLTASASFDTLKRTALASPINGVAHNNVSHDDGYISQEYTPSHGGIHSHSNSNTSHNGSFHGSTGGGSVGAGSHNGSLHNESDRSMDRSMDAAPLYSTPASAATSKSHPPPPPYATGSLSRSSVDMRTTPADSTSSLAITTAATTPRVTVASTARGGRCAGGDSFVLTPSPSDSGVGELEAMLRDRDATIQQLREIMERNESAILQVCMEKEKNWDQELHDIHNEWQRRWCHHTERARNMEQALLQQLFKLQQDRKALNRDLESVRAELKSSEAKFSACDANLTSVRAKLEETHWEVAQKNGEIALLKSQLKESKDEASTKGNDIVSIKSVLKQTQHSSDEKDNEILNLEAQLKSTKEELTLKNNELQYQKQELSTLTHELNAARKGLLTAKQETDLKELQLAMKTKEFDRFKQDQTWNTCAKLSSPRHSPIGGNNSTMSSAMLFDDHHSFGSPLQDNSLMTSHDLSLLAIPKMATSLNGKSGMTDSFQFKGKPMTTLNHNNNSVSLTATSGSGTDDVASLKAEIYAVREEFTRERDQWLEEKNKVIRYQKHLQLNYVQMYRKNKLLEAEVEQLTLELEKRDVALLDTVKENVNEESIC